MKKTIWSYVVSCLILSAALSIFITSCSRNVKVENMMPKEFNVIKRHPYTVNVKVTGQMGLSSARNKKDAVDHDKLTQVMQQSIIESGLFAGLASQESADYLLEIVVFNANILRRPTATITTVVPMSWVLMSRNPRRSVYSVRTEYPASVKASEQLGGANRYSSANEISVNKSIQQGIHELSLIDL